MEAGQRDELVETLATATVTAARFAKLGKAA
jgi:hypothetical protein